MIDSNNTIPGSRTQVIGVNDRLTVGASQTVDVGANSSLTVCSVGRCWPAP